MRKEFMDSVLKSGYIHRPLRLTEDLSYENHHKKDEVLLRDVLFSHEENKIEWKHRGRGKSFMNDDHEIVLSSPHVYSSWPKGAPEDGDYTNYGDVCVYCEFDKKDMQSFNRIYFEVKPDCPGMVNPHVMVSIKNDGVIKIPDIYNREGYHTVNLKNNEWNQCFLDVSDLPRDAIIEIAFSVLINGKDRATLDQMSLTIRKIEIQKVKTTSISKGWIPQDKQMIYSHNGYHTKSRKIAIMKNKENDKFDLMNDSNESVYQRKVQTVETEIGTYSLLDFSEFEEEGYYQLCVGDICSETFKIDRYQERWHESIYRSLNFIFCERCGCPVPDTHGSCHEDIIATHNGQTMIFNGGWHDAGDLSQQLVQTAEVALALFEMCKVIKDKDEQLYLRLLEEAEWGFDFILKTRFGDGFRATSAGITRWSDCLIGNMDDTVARVHDNAYENFFLSGIEGCIALAMDDDNRLKAKAIDVAKQDFDFAFKKFEVVGFEHEPIFWEHTYNMSESLYLATIIWTSCILYQITQEQKYATYAKEWADQLLKCQETNGIELFNQTTLKGFFYRDHTHKVIQHFNHQAREHMYAKALDMLIETHVCDEKNNEYLESMKLYGEYLKYLMNFTYPYPMIASGAYLDNEYLDEESFNRQHLLVGEEAKQDYLKQLEVSHQVGPHIYIKKFPVWFSFKGNNGILLSMGKSASLIGKRLKDQDLLEIAEGQLQWMVGMNPFGQSLVYGEGHDYAGQYSVQTGEMVGEMPVGIQTFENEDDPYWPQLTNATYKEVWVGLAGKWLDILVDLYQV